MPAAGPVRVRLFGPGRSWLGVSVLAGGVALGGCRRSSEVTEAPMPGPPVAAGPAEAKGPAPGVKAVAAARGPIELLPEETDAVVTVASVQHLLRVFDVAALTARYRVQYDQAAAYVEQATGHNLLEPRNWTAVGVDPEGPIGAALLDPGAQASCVFFTLSDPQRFREFLDRIGGKIGGPLGPVYEDRGVVLAQEPDAETSLVLRDSFAFIVTVDHPERAPYDFARELASIDPARALAASSRFRQAVGPAPPRDLFAFVDIAGLLRRAQARREDEATANWAEIELQRLREQGAAAEEIARWEQVASDQRVAEARYRERRRREQELWSSVFGAMGPLVLEWSLEARAVHGTVRAQAPESTLARRILGRPVSPPLAITGAGERVLFGSGVNVDIAGALGVLEPMLAVEGKSLDAFLAEVKAKLHVDVRAVLAAIDGSVSVAVTVKDERDLSAAKGPAAFGFNFALGLKDPSAGQALVEAMLAKPASPGVKVRRVGTRGFAVSLPNYREIRVAVAGSTLTISTDPEFARRIDRGAQGRLDRAVSAAVVPVVGEREASSVWLLDTLLPMALNYMVRRTGYSDEHPTRNQPYWRFPEAEQARIDAVPQSPAYKTKLREWQRIEAKIQRAEEAEAGRRTRLIAKIAEAVGTAAVNLRETGDGIVLTGGQYFGPGGLGAAIEAGVEVLSGSERVDYALYEQRGRVDRELQEIRVRDIERALGVRSGQ